jgi:large subunit ribosomal protein L4
MIEAPHFSSAGARKSADLGLPEEFFDGTVNGPVMHEAVKVFMANQRQGTAATKTRALVSGGNQKPWKQKGTGRARQGSIRAPNWPGGGKVFGPQPRDYRLGMPKKVKQLARKSALNARAAEGALFVVERFEQQRPKTKELVALLDKLGLAGKKVLFLTHGVSEALYLSARNLPRVDVLPYSDASAYDVLWCEIVVVEEPALADEPAEPYVREFVPTVKTEHPVREKKAPVAKQAAAKVTKQAAKKAVKATKKADKAEKKPAAKKAPVKKPAAKKAVAKKAAPKKAAPKKKGGK